MIGPVDLQMKLRTFLIIICTILFLSSCTKKDDCFTADSVKLIQSFTIDGQKHSLYLRVSGFHEKEVFYEIYENDPAFDSCGRPDRSAVSVTHVDFTRGQLLKLVIEGMAMTVFYIQDGNGETRPDRIPIVFK